MTNYNDLNIFEKANLAKDLNLDSVDQLASILKSGKANRSRRRRIEKSLNRIDNIYRQVQKHVDKSAYEQYQNAVDKNFLHFFAILALTMKEDYLWREDATHDQISSLLERVDKKIKKYANQGYTTEDIVKIVDEKCDIQLVPDEH